MTTMKKLSESELKNIVGGSFFGSIGNFFKDAGDAIGNLAVAGADEVTGNSSGANQALDNAGEDALDSGSEIAGALEDGIEILAP